MNKAAILAVVAVLSLALSGVLGYRYAKALERAAAVTKELTLAQGSLRTAEERLRASEASRKHAATVASRRLREAEVARQAVERQNKELNHALQSAPEWAAGAVPDSVRRALEAGGVSPGPGGAP